MSESATGTPASQLNAAQAAARIATAAQANAESKPTATKRAQSAATRKANATAKSATAPKPASKPAAAKPAKVTKITTPSLRSCQQDLATAVIAAGLKCAASYKLPKNAPTEFDRDAIPMPAGSFGGRRNKSA
jgi:hypothetical protein